MPPSISTPDFFSFLGLPRKLRIDMSDLEQRYRALSRQFHPDYFYNASAAERRQSLERSSFLNDAYRTLKNPVARIEYLLKIEGFGSNAADRSPQGAEGGMSPTSKQVPPGLLEEVFALNEELDEVRELRSSGAAEDEWKARLMRARQPIDAKRAEHETQLQELSDRWDAEGDRDVLKQLRDRILERNYITNLLAGIERELAQSL
jgi:molecular chaperone HscB